MTAAQELDADVVIVGSGVAGAICAHKLAQDGARVLILEAGPRVDRANIVRNFTRTHHMDFSAGFPNEKWAPRPHWGDDAADYIVQDGPEAARMEYLRVVGGTTWHWTGSCIRFLPVEMRMKSAYGVGVDWPFPYDELEPYYTAAEQEMGVAGHSGADDGAPRSADFPLPQVPFSYADKTIAAGLAKIGVDCAPRPAARNTREYGGRGVCQGYGTCSPICPTGAQYNAMVHVNLAEKAGAKVVENARVERIAADEGGNVTQVAAALPDGTAVIARGKIFVLAANAMETPRLLLMSANERYPGGIANSTGMVGRNFFEHPGLYCRFLMPVPVYPGRGPQSTMTSYSFRDGSFRRERAGWLMSTVHSPFRVHEAAAALLSKGHVPPELDARMHDLLLREVQIDAQIEQLPNADNGMTLDWDKRDSAGQPQMRLYYSFSEYEQRAFAHVRQTFVRMATALGGEVTRQSEPFAHHHPMGMTRMGASPKDSVVDAECRSHDHKNLFVISSSVFPTGGTANPTLTIAALSLRAAGGIKAQLGE